MNRFLRALGQLCTGHRKTVVLLWALLVGGLVFWAQSAGSETTNSLVLKGAGSQAVTDGLDKYYPNLANGSSPIVFKADSGTLTSGPKQAAVEQALSNLKRNPHVRSLTDPFGGTATPQISSDGTVAYTQVYLDVTGQNLTEEIASGVLDSAQSAESAGIAVSAGGSVGEKISAPENERSEVFGILAAIVVLLVAFRSIAAMGMPILTGVAGVATGVSVITLLSHPFSIPTVAPTLAIMLGLGVGIDYSLFLLSGHRARLREGVKVRDSIIRGVGTTGATILFAGGTVILAMCSLAVADISLITSLGFAGAIGVAASILAALTLLPALLMLLGRRVLPKHERDGTRKRRAAEFSPGWLRWAKGITKRPVLSVAAGLVILVPLAIPIFSLQFGQPDDGAYPTDETVRQAYDTLSGEFGPGTNGTIQVLAEFPKTVDPRIQSTLATLQSDIAATDGVASVTPPVVSESRTAALLTVTPTTAPSDEATKDLVSRLADTTVPKATASTGVSADVGGVTAAYDDLADEISSKLLPVILVVIALSFAMLVLAFRSILIPLQAALMNLFSVAAAYGILVAAFQWGWGAGLLGLDGAVPIVSYVPLMMFAILFGLSMDYEFFLISHIKEQFRKRRKTREAVEYGVASSGGVITSAALIMVTVFGSFVLSTDPTIKQFGLGLAAAVAIDATVVRSFLVPSLMTLLGKANWWFPRFLRWLPKLDIDEA